MEAVIVTVSAGPCTGDSTALLQESGSSMAAHAISAILVFMTVRY
jgi:hypothetical protein